MQPELSDPAPSQQGRRDKEAEASGTEAQADRAQAEEAPGAAGVRYRTSMLRMGVSVGVEDARGR